MAYFRLCIERLCSEGYGHTRFYGSRRVVIFSTGLVRVRVRVRLTVLCYGYVSGS